MNKPLFSFALIARNEAKTLPRLILSLKEFQDRGGKVFLLDTGSTDNTAEIARQLGCEVTEVGDKFLTILSEDMAKKINNHFIVSEKEAPIVKEGDRVFDFASARNFIADIADTDFVSMPDCDEIYTAFDIDKINGEIEKGAEQFEYNFVFSHDNKGNPETQFMHSKFYNKKKIKWVGVVHEVLMGEVKKVVFSEDVIKLEHFQNVETNRGGYMTGLALDCFLNPSNDRNTHYLGRELIYAKRYESAIHLFKRHIEMPHWWPEGAQSMTFIGDCYRYLGNATESKKWYCMSFDKEPNRREPLIKLAELYKEERQWMNAIAYATAALTIEKETSFYANFQPYMEDIPHAILYLGYWYLGNMKKSREHFDIAYKYQPEKYKNDRSFYYVIPEYKP